MTETLSRPFTAASFNQYISEKKLMGSRCPECKAVYIPPRAICPHCHHNKLAWTEFSGQGKLAAFTSVYIAPTFMIDQGYGRDKPYLAGIVELDEGPQISTRIVGLNAVQPEQAWIGTPVIVEFLTRGEGEDVRTDLAFRRK
jgi:uncharacterized OB-fold protein